MATVKNPNCVWHQGKAFWPKLMLKQGLPPVAVRQPVWVKFTYCMHFVPFQKRVFTKSCQIHLLNICVFPRTNVSISSDRHLSPFTICDSRGGDWHFWRFLHYYTTAGTLLYASGAGWGTFIYVSFIASIYFLLLLQVQYIRIFGIAG